MAEKLLTWEVDVLSSITADYFTIRKAAVEMHPQSFTSVKPKESIITEIFFKA
jgi:hypothetical protein